MRASAAAIASTYNRAAPWYDTWAWQTFWDKNELPLVQAELSRLGHPGRAIDLGTGTGRYVAALREAGADAFGIDASREMISIAARKLKSRDRLVVEDLHADSLTLGTFQTAIAARVFCHSEDVIGAFMAASRLVDPGGRLIVTELDPSHRFERTRIPTPSGKLEIGTWKRGSKELISAAEASGWRVDRVLHVTPKDCSWLPDRTILTSIARTSDRPIFNLLSFSRC